MKRYGTELIFDVHDCSTRNFDSYKLQEFVKELCKKINMKVMRIHIWDFDTKEEREKAPPHLAGVSVCCFIQTSSIVVHTLDKLKKVFVNCFSCKDFNSNTVIDFTEEFFSGKMDKMHFIERK